VTEDERLAPLAALQRRVADLRARLPRHSPPTAMMVEIDELEDEARRLERERSSAQATASR